MPMLELHTAPVLSRFAAFFSRLLIGEEVIEADELDEGKISAVTRKKDK